MIRGRCSTGEGRLHLGDVGVGFVVELLGDCVVRVLDHLHGLEACRRGWEARVLHIGELLGEDGLDRVFVVAVMRKVEKDGVGVNVGILGRVDPYKALVLANEWAVSWGD
jgi:hypothetical protein